MKQGTALISGASSGIGEALAKQFAKAGYDLVLVARRKEKLQAVSKKLERSFNVSIRVESLDLSNAQAAQTLYSTLAKDKVDVDVLVNNAGVLEHGLFVDRSAQDFKRIIDLNITGLTEMLHTFLPDMVRRGRGKILNVGSIAAFQPVPSLAVYAASKAYVLSLTEALSEEHRDSGVSFTALCPGITETEMVTGIEQTEGIKKLPKFVVGDVVRVAEQGFKACMNGQVICIPETINKATVMSLSNSPRWLMRKITGVLGRASV